MDCLGFQTQASDQRVVDNDRRSCQEPFSLFDSDVQTHKKIKIKNYPLRDPGFPWKEELLKWECKYDGHYDLVWGNGAKSIIFNQDESILPNVPPAFKDAEVF